jgi:hypothetical protein
MDTNKTCLRCKQTIPNCECHIPYSEKHKQLIDYAAQLRKNYREKYESKHRDNI